MIARYWKSRSSVNWAAGVMVLVVVGCGGGTGAKEDAAKKQPVVEKKTTEKEEAENKADEAVRVALEKKIGDVRWDGMPLVDAMDYLREKSGVNISVNWPAMEVAGVEKSVAITTRMHDLQLRRALKTVLRDAGGGADRLGYTVKDGIIWVTTKEELDKEDTVTRVYDIRDLLVVVPEQVGPEFRGTGVVVDEAKRLPASAPAVESREARLASFISLLETTVDPDSWRDSGGTVGSMRELQGELIVTQTKENQEVIGRLLNQLRESRGVQITIEARYVHVSEKALEGMGLAGEGAEKQDGGGAYLKEPDRFLRGVQKYEGTTILAAPRVTLFNGMRGYVMVGSDRPYVENYVMVKGKGGETRYEPEVGHVMEGTTLDLQATASRDRKDVTVTLKSKVTKVKGTKSRAFKGGEGLEVQEPEVETEKAEATFSIPDGGTGVVVQMGSGGEGGRTFILVKPRVIVQGWSGK